MEYWNSFKNYINLLTGHNRRQAPFKKHLQEPLTKLPGLVKKSIETPEELKQPFQSS